MSIISFKTAVVLPTSTPLITSNGLHGVPVYIFQKGIAMAVAYLSMYIFSVLFISLSYTYFKQLRYTHGDLTCLLHPYEEVHPTECRYRDMLLPMAWLVGYDHTLSQRVIHSNLGNSLHFVEGGHSLAHWITLSTDSFLPNLLGGVGHCCAWHVRVQSGLIGFYVT
jgi:hypothetical protein